MKINYFVLLGGLIGACLNGALWAAEGVVDASSKPWSNSAEVSVVSTNGNSKGTTTKASDSFKYEWPKELLELGGSGLGSSNQSQVTAEEYHANEKIGWKFDERNYAFENTGWDKNRFAGIRSRYDPTAGYGRKILDMSDDKLTGEIGAGYLFEKHTDTSQYNFATGRLYFQYTHVLSATADFSQDAEYLPRLDDPSNFHLNTKTALTVSITTHFALKASFEWKRQNRPPTGFIRDDTLTSTALVMNY